MLVEKKKCYKDPFSQKSINVIVIQPHELHPISKKITYPM